MTTTFGGLFSERCKFQRPSATPRLAEIAQFPRASLSFPAVAGACAFLRKLIMHQTAQCELEKVTKKSAFLVTGYSSATVSHFADCILQTSPELVYRCEARVVACVSCRP